MAKNIFLKNMDRIHEEIFKISDRRDVFKKLFWPNYGDEKKWPSAYAVYAGDFSYIAGDCFKNKKELGRSFKKELKSFIELYDPKRYEDFLFFKDAHSTYSKKDPSIKELLSWQFQRCEPVDAILSESRGFLLWTYQFDNLLRFFGYDEWERIKKFTIKNNMFRTINPAEASRWETLLMLDVGFTHRKNYQKFMKTLKFTDQISMYDVMKERRIKNSVHHPNIKAAYILYKTLKGEKEYIYN